MTCYQQTDPDYQCSSADPLYITSNINDNGIIIIIIITIITIIIIQGLSTLSHSQKWRVSRARGHSVTGGTHDCIDQF